MISQYFLLAMFQIIGILFLSKYDASYKFIVYLGLLLGVIFSIQAVLLSIYIMGEVSNVFIYSVLSCISATFIVFNRNKIIKLLKEKVFLLDLVLFNLSILAIIYFYQNIYLTPDSFHYHSIAQGLYQNIITNNFLKTFEWLLITGRLIFLDSLIMIGFSAGIDIFGSLFLVLGISAIMLVHRMILVSLGVFKITLWRVPIITFFILFVFSIKDMVFHFTYYHTNLLTGVFWSIGTIMLFVTIIIRNQNEIVFFRFFGFVFLAVTILIRKEMILFSLFPIGMYFLVSNLKIKEMYFYLLLYVVIGYQWFTFYALKVNNLNTSFTAHGSSLDYIISASFLGILPLMIYIIKKVNFSIKTVSMVFYIVYFIIIISLLNVDFQETINTIQKLFTYTLINIKLWGLFWIMLFISLITLKEEKINFLFVHTILLFLITRIVIYVFSDGLVDSSSGDRIMIHMSFFGFFIIFYNIYSLVVKINKHKK